MEQASQPVAPLGEAGAGTSESGEGSKAEAAVDGVRHVAAETQEHAGQLAREAWTQARDVLGRASGEARTQADQQAAKAASGMNTIAEQLRALADGRSEQSGQVSQYARRAGDQIAQLAQRLEGQGMQGLVDGISGFARRRPGQFMLLAAGTGFLAGRAVRASQAAREQGQEQPELSSPYGSGSEPLDLSTDQAPRLQGTSAAIARGDTEVAPLPPPEPVVTGEAQPGSGR